MGESPLLDQPGAGASGWFNNSSTLLFAAIAVALVVVLFFAYDYYRDWRRGRRLRKWQSSKPQD
jgi:hypothetical protein